MLPDVNGDMTCVFCSPDAERVFFCGERTLGLWDAFPVSPGHALLIPKRHVATWFDASLDEQRDLASAIAVARRAILERYSPDGFNVGINVGDAGGQTVPHLHVHVIPRYRGDVADPRGGVRGVIPDKKIYDLGAVAPAVGDRAEDYDAASASTATSAAFGERIIQLLDQGKFTTTYKLAALLGLLDVCLQRTSENGAAPASISTRDLAERVLELYWPHATPFSGTENGAPCILAQGASGQAEIVSSIVRFRERHGGRVASAIGAVRRAAPAAFDRLVDQIEWKLIEMPLPRLQWVGDQESDFLYRIGWDRAVKRRDVASGAVDRRLHLVAGAGEHLVQLAGVLRPLIERQWVAMVANLNRNVTGELVLQEFLFGAARIALDPVRDDLRDLQDGRCFYCQEKLSVAPHVDHFLPWARFPDNGIDNLVAADPQCNARKRDFLAAAAHVETWRARHARNDSDLAQIATRAGWDRRADRTLGVARAVYLRLPQDVKLWESGTHFVAVGPQRHRIRAALSTSDSP